MKTFKLAGKINFQNNFVLAHMEGYFAGYPHAVLYLNEVCNNFEFSNRLFEKVEVFQFA